MVGRKGLEPSQIALSVPKTDASTNSAIAPQIQLVLYIIGTICPMTIVKLLSIYFLYFVIILKELKERKIYGHK